MWGHIGGGLLPEAKNGKLTLVAVEWIVRYDTETGQPPTPQLVLGDIVEPFHGLPPDNLIGMLGHEHWPGSPYQGPSPGQEEWMPYHYDLHAWIWKDNPNGDFADWNPTVKCPTTP